MGVVAVATNFTERADRALRRAALLARRGGDELLVVHVIDESEESNSPGDAREAAESKLSAIAASLLDVDGVRSTTEIRDGRVAEEICEAAAGANAHVIVVGAHRGMLRDMVENTTAQQLVRLCSLSVLAANCHPGADYEKAVLATDLSEANLRCADEVHDLSLISAGQLIVLHVYDPEASTMLGRAFSTGEERSAYFNERGTQAQEELRDWIEQSGLQAAELQVRPSVGSVPEDILAAAQEQSVDLIVVCNRSEGPVKRTVVGSVTEALLRNVEIDVFVTTRAD